MAHTVTDEIETAEEFAEELWIEETDDPPPHHYAVMIAKRDAAIVAKARADALRANAAELAAHREALAEIHKRVARGDGHGTVAMTRDCTISAILDLKSGLIEERESALKECEEIAEARIDVSDGTGSEYDRGWARCAQVIRDHIRALPGFPKDYMI